MASALLINTAAVPLFTSSQPKEWYQDGGLVMILVTILLPDAIFPPLFFYIDMQYYMNARNRARLTQARIDDWNQTIKQNMGSSVPEQKKRNQVKKQVDQWKQFFEPSEMDNPRRYANAMNSFFCCLFFSPVSPFTPLIGILGLSVQYAMDKYLLLRWYKRPSK